MPPVANRLAPSFAQWRLLALALPFWWGLCWLSSGLYFERATEKALQHEIVQADLFVDNLAHGFDRIIKVRAGMPRLLARDPAYWKALKYVGQETAGAHQPFEERQRRWTEDPILAATSLQLGAAADELNVTAIALLDTTGNCFAANNAGSDQSWVGVNYGDREYFPEILAGRSGYRINVGKQYGVPGLILFAPVIDNGKVLGVVIAKNDLAQFGNWLATEDAFVTDRYGVIVLAHDPTLLMRTTTDAPVHQFDETKRLNLYRQSEFAPLRIADWGDPRYPGLRRVEGREHPVILRSRSVAIGDEPAAHILRPFPQLTEFANYRRNVVVGFGTASTLAALLLAVALRRRHERRLYLQTLEQREREYRTLTSNLPEMVLRYDHELRRTYANSAWERASGQRFADIAGMPPTGLGGDCPETVTTYTNRLRRVLATEQPDVFDLPWMLHDGTLRWLQTRAAPEFDVDGKVSGVIVVSTDITRLVQMDEKLRQSEQDYRSLAENSPDNIIRYDRKHRIRYLNSRLVADLGLSSAEEVIGRRPIDIWPDGRYSGIDKAAAQAIKSGSPTTIELVWPDGSGQQRHGMVVVVPELDIEGNIVGTIAIGRDITALKQSEVAFRELSARLAATLDAIPDLLFELDRNGTYLDIRAPDPQLLIAPKDRLLGRTFAEMLPADAATSLIAALREADLSGKAYGQLIRLDLASGVKWFETSVAKKVGTGTADASFILLSRDVTERVSAETARAASLAEAQALAQQRQDFIAHMSHELRTPLNGILGQAQRLVADTTLSKRNIAAVAAIRNDGERLLESIDDILDLTGIENEQNELHPSSFMLAGFLRSISEAYKEKARLKGLQFALKLGQELPVSVYLDAHRLRQMLGKLLDNAIKFTAQGRVELRIELTTANRLCCVVLDTGIGIPPARLPSLFEPFTPGGDLLRRPSGSGLGLTIVHRLARRMGCRLSVDSKPGSGSVFTIELSLPDMPEALPPSAATFTPLTEETSIETPPPEELAMLHRLALLGNMRDILRETRRISALDSRYHSFTKQLQHMAENYQSKALLAFIEASHTAVDNINDNPES